MWAIYEKELSSYFNGLTGYLFGAFLLLFVGLASLVYNLNSAIANFEYVLGSICIVYVVLVPVLTMRSIAEERKQKTDQLLYSLPISTYEIVIGKFLAIVTVLATPLLFVALYPYIFSKYGNVYLPTSYGSLFAFLLLGASLIAMGMFISSLFESQGAAAGVTIAVLIFNYYMVSLSEYTSSSAFGSLITLCLLSVLIGVVIKILTKSSTIAYLFPLISSIVMFIVYFIKSELFENLVVDALNNLSLFERFYVFINGIFDVTGIVYFVTVIIFFLYLTVLSIDKRRYN